MSHYSLIINYIKFKFCFEILLFLTCYHLLYLLAIILITYYAYHLLYLLAIILITFYEIYFILTIYLLRTKINKYNYIIK